MRKWLIKIENYPPISARKFYRVEITDVGRKKKSDGITVTVLHLSAEQEGRCHNFILTLPIRASGNTARFFAACGIEIAIGKQIDPKSVIGTNIQVRFSQNDAGNYEPVEFRSMKSNNTNDVNTHQEGGA